MRLRARSSSVVVVLILGCAAPEPDVEVTESVYHDISPALTDLAPAWPEAVTPPTVLAGPSPALVSFEGMGQGMTGFTVDSAPPDPSGDVGPNHYVQMVNTAFAVFNKSGSRLYGPLPTKTLWTGFPGPCATTNDGDGMVRYDRLADRWVLTQFSVNGGNGPYYQCIAVSTSPDPTGSYARYAFPYTAFNDYPKVAVWPDAYYFTYNMFPNLQFAGGKVCAMDRARMLTGQPATQQCFDTTTDYGGLLVADLDGPRPPPAGEAAHVLSLGTANDDLASWRFHVDFTNPASSTFTGPSHVTVPAYTPMCNGERTCVPQPGTTSKLDGLDDRLMPRFVYRNYGDHEALFAAHAVQAGSGTGAMRWYELRPDASFSSLAQFGTSAPSMGDYRWMGSIAADAVGDVAIGYSISSSAIYPSLRYAWRTATDPSGLMANEATLHVGTGAQTGFNFLTRWGDYSSLTIDPSDDCTFWYTGEYLASNGEFNWHTRIANFRVPGCVVEDPTLPTVWLISPADGAVLAGTITIEAGATDDVGVTRVDLLVDGVLLASPTAPPYLTTFDTTTLPDGGPYTVTAIAYDDAGHSATANAYVSVDNVPADTTPPTTAITSPLAGATVSGTVTIAASASDDVGVTEVEFYVDGLLLEVDPTPPYQATWDTRTVANGSYYLFTRASDAAGNSQTSTPVNVTVSNVPVELLKNGGFESPSLKGWTAVGPVARSTTTSNTGNASARVGSTTAFNGDAILSQTVTIPTVGTTRLRLAYLLRCQYDTHVYDQQQAYVLDHNGAVLHVIFDTCGYTTTWTTTTLDLTPYRGQQVTITFRDHDDGLAADPTWFYVDNVSVKNYP